MSHYVLSDIHGEKNRFDAMLEKIRFSESDRLYILGDVVDRGPNGISLLMEIMRMPRATMILGNHEHMFLRYLSPDCTQEDVMRWNRNGNAPTLAEFEALGVFERRAIKNFLRSMDTHLEVEVQGKKFYLVHGFPGDNVHDEVWARPEPAADGGVEGQLIIGHTPVYAIGRQKEERNAYIEELETRGDHLEIYHGPTYINVDCGCGHGLKCSRLACLRLEDLAEWYV